MAQNTIAEEITDLETRITLLDNKIKEHQHLREVNEGGDFVLSLVDASKLYDRRDILNTRLQTLYRGSA